MSVEKDRERLSQTKMLAWLKREPPLMEMFTVYLSGQEYPSIHGTYCALIQTNSIEQALAKFVMGPKA